MTSAAIVDALSAATSNQTLVSIHPLFAGSLTLPEHLFVQPADKTKRSTVPSLSFLIQHPAFGRGNNPTRLVFDLGIRRDTSRYAPPIQKHLLSRHPVTTSPDVKESLAIGGLTPEDVDYVILSHVHWDHIGTPTDFPTSNFIVGPGSLELLRKGGDTSTGSHAFFEPDLLPAGRTYELPSIPTETDRAVKTTKGVNGHPSSSSTGLSTRLDCLEWRPLAHFPDAIDLFGDGSIYIINAPGHLQGHINVLARTGPSTWTYLGGDACHDRRLLRGEVQIAEWEGPHGKLCSIHVDARQVEKTLERIRMLEEAEGAKVEVILAHDVEWLRRKGNTERFWPSKL